MNFFATTPKGMELLLVQELRDLGATDASEKLAGVVFSGDLSLAYKACLWSRLANRILLKLSEFPAETPDALYQGVQTIDWSKHLAPNGSLSVNFVSAQSTINHTLFGAQKVKDAIVDQFRARYQIRPNVSHEQPDIVIHVYLYRDKATISLDLAGVSLHRRGYRKEQGEAPLKENLAAALLMRAKWIDKVKEGAVLLDPLCGSGTLLIEAALMAYDIAPGLSRNYFGFLGWKQHDASLWDSILHEARVRAQKPLASPIKIVGFDENSSVIAKAHANIQCAGMVGKVHVEKQPLSELKNTFGPVGLLITNPPYGERLGELAELKALYKTLGDVLKKEFHGWHAALFTGNPDLGKNMGVRAHHRYALFNGPLPCQLLLFEVTDQWFVNRPYSEAPRLAITINPEEKASADMFLNRFKKRYKHFKKMAVRENINCFRVYESDLPEYDFSVDIAENAVLIREYPPGKNVDRKKARKRLQNAAILLAEELQLASEQIFIKSYDQNLEIPDEGLKETFEKVRIFF